MGTTGRGRQGTTAAVVHRGRQPLSSPRDDTVSLWRRQDGDDRTGTTAPRDDRISLWERQDGDDRGRQGLSSRGTRADDRSASPCRPVSPQGTTAPVVPCCPRLVVRWLKSRHLKARAQVPVSAKKKTPTSDSAQPRPLTPRFKVVGRVVVQNFSGSNAGPRWRCRSTLN